MGELKKLQELFESVYLLKDPYVLKMLMAGVISQRLPIDPVWFIIIAPSGGGKSEFINAISTCEGVHSLSTLTSQTFVSGMKLAGGKNASLLLNLNKDKSQEGNGIIAFKDMTSLLSEHKEDRGVIMGQLREIYDGKYAKTFGTGETVMWKGKLTIIAGATYAIHTMKQAYTAMGERFLFYNMIQPDRIDAARKAMENQESGHMKEYRTDITDKTKEYIDTIIQIPEKLPLITSELRDELLILAELATRARSDVEHNWRSPQQEITEVHPPEMPTRFASQLQAFARSLMIVNWNEIGKADLTEDDRVILDKLALDSVTRSRRTAMQELAKYDIIETAGLAVKLGLPTTSVRRWLEDLTALEVAEREKGSSNKDRWKIKDHYKKIITKFEDIKFEGGELLENNAETSEEELLQEAEEAKKDLEQMEIL